MPHPPPYPYIASSSAATLAVQGEAHGKPAGAEVHQLLSATLSENAELQVGAAFQSDRAYHRTGSRKLSEVPYFEELYTY